MVSGTNPAHNRPRTKPLRGTHPFYRVLSLALGGMPAPRFPAGARAQPGGAAHVPDGAAAGSESAAPQHAGPGPAMASPPGLAPVPHHPPADRVGGLRQAAARWAAARPA